MVSLNNLCHCPCTKLKRVCGENLQHDWLPGDQTERSPKKLDESVIEAPHRLAEINTPAGRGELINNLLFTGDRQIEVGFVARGTTGITAFLINRAYRAYWLVGSEHHIWPILSLGWGPLCAGVKRPPGDLAFSLRIRHRKLFSFFNEPRNAAFSACKGNLLSWPAECESWRLTDMRWGCDIFRDEKIHPENMFLLRTELEVQEL